MDEATDNYGGHMQTICELETSITLATLHI